MKHVYDMTSMFIKRCLNFNINCNKSNYLNFNNSSLLNNFTI